MDKILLITGASSDVGLKLIPKIEQEYSMIFLQYRTMNDTLKKIVDVYRDSNKICMIQADFTQESDIEELIRKIKESGRMPNQIIHLPAPKLYNKQFHKDNWENFELGWQICIHSIEKILKAFLPNMSKSKYGRIIFLLSSNTIGKPAKYQSSYVTVKYALLGLMKALAAEYADKGITVNGVSPDMMETKFLSGIPDLIVEQNRENGPMGRNVYVEEILPMIQYMLSEEGASMTGQNIEISGGR